MMKDHFRTQAGQCLSRRRLLYLAGLGSSGAVLAACGSDALRVVEGSTSSTVVSATTPDCVLTPEEIEGPFYTDLNLVRSDITNGKSGSALDLKVTVVDATTCAPIRDATVDIWHADAFGLYSAFTGQGDSADIDTSAESFLRGVQSTNADGIATFTTIYPGWYSGRTTHVHLKIHFADRTHVTTQLYFPDDVTNTVYSNNDAYAERGPKDTSNYDDGFSAALNSLRMTLSESATGNLATHTIGIEKA